MKKMNWIKMGFKIVKIVLIFLLVMIIQANISDKALVKTENFNLNMTLGLTAMAEKEEEEIPREVIIEKNKENSSVINKYTGDLTGYAADCPLCNGTLACKRAYNVYRNNVITYNDETYGNVRIVASSKQLACGTVVRFNASSISSDSIYAIVLDRGVTGNSLDLLMPTEDAARREVGRKKITYEVVRNGW